MENKKRRRTMTISMNPDTLVLLDKIAKEKGLTRSGYVSMIITENLRKEKRVRV